jgi:hypothetical protein
MSTELQVIYDQYVFYHWSFRQDFLIHCACLATTRIPGRVFNRFRAKET